MTDVEINKRINFEWAMLYLAVVIALLVYYTWQDASAARYHASQTHRIVREAAEPDPDGDDHDG